MSSITFGNYTFETAIDYDAGTKSTPPVVSFEEATKSFFPDKSDPCPKSKCQASTEQIIKVCLPATDMDLANTCRLLCDRGSESTAAAEQRVAVTACSVGAAYLQHFQDNNGFDNLTPINYNNLYTGTFPDKRQMILNNLEAVVDPFVPFVETKKAKYVFETGTQKWDEDQPGQAFIDKCKRAPFSINLQDSSKKKRHQPFPLQLGVLMTMFHILAQVAGGLRLLTRFFAACPPVARQRSNPPTQWIPTTEFLHDNILQPIRFAYRSIKRQLCLERGEIFFMRRANGLKELDKAIQEHLRTADPIDLHEVPQAKYLLEADPPSDKTTGVSYTELTRVMELGCVSNMVYDALQTALVEGPDAALDHDGFYDDGEIKQLKIAGKFPNDILRMYLQ